MAIDARSLLQEKNETRPPTMVSGADRVVPKHVGPVSEQSRRMVEPGQMLIEYRAHRFFVEEAT